MKLETEPLSVGVEHLRVCNLKSFASLSICSEFSELLRLEKHTVRSATGMF
jgi:hypothetical protein